jgi:hypothetical protein
MIAPLVFETAHRDYLASLAIAALSGVNLFRGHESAPLNEEDGGDYIVLVSGLPGGDLREAGVYEISLEFQVFTDVSQNRETQTAKHAERVRTIFNLFGEQRFLDTRREFNAVAAAAGVQINGWEPEDGEEGTTDAEQQVTTLRYSFEAYVTA